MPPKYGRTWTTNQLFVIHDSLEMFDSELTGKRDPRMSLHLGFERWTFLCRRCFCVIEVFVVFFWGGGGGGGGNGTDFKQYQVKLRFIF